MHATHRKKQAVYERSEISAKIHRRTTILWQIKNDLSHRIHLMLNWRVKNQASEVDVFFRQKEEVDVTFI